ncbi:MAG: AbrB/MazE/SpoVT family DNA-binding domain-containing protein [Actinomycetales bacterium]|jgi:AbrB family looped-hinge helix DNA binding protein
MTVTVGPKGQVVIPKEFRDQLGIRPGDRVDFFWETDRLVVRLARPERALRGRFAGDGLVDDLLRSRARDRALEDS